MHQAGNTRELVKTTQCEKLQNTLHWSHVPLLASDLQPFIFCLLEQQAIAKRAKYDKPENFDWTSLKHNKIANLLASPSDSANSWKMCRNELLSNAIALELFLGGISAGIVECNYKYRTFQLLSIIINYVWSILINCKSMLLITGLTAVGRRVSWHKAQTAWKAGQHHHHYQHHHQHHHQHQDHHCHRSHLPHDHVQEGSSKEWEPRGANDRVASSSCHQKIRWGTSYA